MLTVYLHCEVPRKLEITRALQRQGIITDEDVAAYEDAPAPPDASSCARSTTGGDYRGRE